MRRVLLIALLCLSLAAPDKIIAQNAFTPISRSSYARNQEFLDRNFFDDYPLAIVNFMLSYSLVPEPFVSLSLRIALGLGQQSTA